MEASEQLKIPDQLLCSVCMCLLKNPVTIQCGHTFCRVCLMNSVSLKYKCPICRKVLSHFTQRPHQDRILVNVIEYFNKKILSSSDTNQASEKFLLLDIRTNQLLLPFTKVVGTFQLQSPTLISKFQGFVARQEPPFNKYGIISKIIFLNQLRFNVYQCVIQGKFFCQIQNQTVQKSQQLNQQFFYRNCSAKIIYEEQGEILEQDIITRFFLLFSKIKDRSILQNVYKVVDSQVFNSRSDNLAIFYSIFRLMAVQDNKKYAIITKFNKQDRKIFLSDFLNRIDFDVSKTPYKFINVKATKYMKKQLAIYFLCIILFLFLFIRSQTARNNQTL